MNTPTAPSPPRAIDTLLARYADSHRHRSNEIIHCICVPAIMFSLLGLLWSLHPGVALVASLAALLYYLALSPAFAIGMTLMAAAMLAALYALPANAVLTWSLAIFILAWIGQFIGHKIEGKKPSFFEDVRFLLIGPLFVLAFLYRRLQLKF